MDYKTINLDYIGVVRQKADGRFAYERQEIENPYRELINQLEDMAKNDNRNVLDLQDLFLSAFPQGQVPQGYNYCYPNDYFSSYVYGVGYPSMFSFDEYNNRLSEIKSKAIAKARQIAEQNNLTEKYVQEASEREVKLECKVLRQEFANHACLYIKAYCYHLAIDRVQYESSRFPQRDTQISGCG